MRPVPTVAVVLVLAGCLSAQQTARHGTPEVNPGTPPALRLPLERAQLLSPFGKRGRRFHEGLDLRWSKGGGDPVLAAGEGLVAEAGKSRGYGRMVLIRHPGGWYTRYGHLRSFRVRKGDRVQAGEKIGTVGGTGRATTPHLHFEVLTPKRRAVDPAPLVLKK